MRTEAPLSRGACLMSRAPRRQRSSTRRHEYLEQLQSRLSAGQSLELRHVASGISHCAVHRVACTTQSNSMYGDVPPMPRPLSDPSACAWSPRLSIDAGSRITADSMEMCARP